MNVNKLLDALAMRHPGENEYLQAVREVLLSVEEVYNQYPEFETNKIAERLVEPDRIFTFKVPWVDDRGVVADRFAEAGSMYLLNSGDFKLHQLGDWRWIEGNEGKVLHQNADTATYHATLVKYADMICDRPLGQALIKVSAGS